MSVQDLRGGTFQTKDLIQAIVNELDDLLNPETDKEAGRVELADRKIWLNEAIREFFRQYTNPRPELRPDFQDPPDDTLRESER